MAWVLMERDLRSGAAWNGVRRHIRCVGDNTVPTVRGGCRTSFGLDPSTSLRAGSRDASPHTTTGRLECCCESGCGTSERISGASRSLAYRTAAYRACSNFLDRRAAGDREKRDTDLAKRRPGSAALAQPVCPRHDRGPALARNSLERRAGLRRSLRSVCPKRAAGALLGRLAAAARGRFLVSLYLFAQRFGAIDERSE
jgi:hypothetical protein